MTLVRSKLLLLIAVLTVVFGIATPMFGQTAISPSQMKMLGQVDPRFVSYNVEAVEVTGGRFWAPFKSMPKGTAGTPPGAGGPIGNPADSRFQYRAPIDLRNAKLRKLAAALGPAYVRVSGTWRNSTYFQDNDEPALKTPPPGFQNVMTRAEWKGVVDFAHEVNAEIVSSVTTSMGVRAPDGVWTSTQAKALFDYTKSVGGHIAAMEFMNEPTLMNFGGAGDKYGASEYARDSRIFGDFLRKESPGALYLGPSSAAEGLPEAPLLRLIPTEQLMQATGPIFDAFSYHVYYTRSRRCNSGSDPNKALDAEYLNRGLGVERFYAKLRDKFLPGKDLWLTETGEASCGGDTWASEFLDSFRLLDQFGSLAQRSVKTIMYNTLASSDYGMIDEETYEPRPNYWAALLWKRTMGTRSLDPGVAGTDKLRVYAQCMKDAKGGVSILVLNIDKSNAQSLKLPIGGRRYTLSKTVLLNGKAVTLASDGAVPTFTGDEFKKGIIPFAPTTITVLTLPAAENKNCTLP
jgi:heparanase 1